jgi:hypothetical protein
MRRPPSEPRRIRSGEAGFSLLETLIAAALLLMVLIGILPLFERSRLNIVQGGEANRSANAVVDVSERMLSLPFNNFGKNLAAGSGLSRVDTDFWLLDADVWDAAVPVGDTAQLTRQLTIEQFNSSALEDDLLVGFEGGAPPINEALEDDALPGTVHLKRFHVRMTSPRTEGGAGYTVISVQAF